MLQSVLKLVNFGAIVGNTVKLSINCYARIIREMKKISLVMVSMMLAAQQVFAQTREQKSSGGTQFDGIIPTTGTGDEAVTGLARRIQTGTVEVGDVLYFIVKLIDLVSILAGSVCLLMLLYGGYQYMISGLNDDKESAKKTFRYAITGFVLTFLAYLIVNLVFSQFTGQGMKWGWS